MLQKNCINFSNLEKLFSRKVEIYMKNYVAKNFKILFVFVLILIVLTASNFLQINIYAENESDFCINAKSGILVDYSSGEVLFEQDADNKLQIASMVKLMTIYLVIEKLEAGELKLTDKLIASEYASSMEGSQVFIDANSRYTIEDMLKSVIVASANDASVALAEHISGSEKNFVKKMNNKAKELGMKNTIYVNSTGLPAPMQYSTARDCSIILSKLIDNEIYLKYSTIWMDELTHPSGRKTELVNTNKLIRYYKGCDIGKTGSTDEAGYCLSASAKRNEMRLIAVVMGTKNSNERFSQTVNLLDYGFSNFVNKKIVDKEIPVQKINIKKSKLNEIEIFAKDDFYAITSKDGESNLTITREINENLKAPLKNFDEVGKIIISKNGKIIKEIPLIIKIDVDEITFIDGLKKIVHEF